MAWWEVPTFLLVVVFVLFFAMIASGKASIDARRTAIIKSGYAFCGTCRGTGNGGVGQLCSVCEGNGKGAAAALPSGSGSLCSHCYGSGKGYTHRVCPFCMGKGWMDGSDHAFLLRHADEWTSAPSR